MKCTNVAWNCKWVGTVGKLEKHVVTCKFNPVPCPKQCRDDSGEITLFMKKQLEEHLKVDCPNRDYTCENCGEKGTYAIITQVHDQICPNKNVSCPNTGCTDTMQHQHVKEHVTTKCEYTVLLCKFKTLGCETELKRKDMTAHEEDYKFHLQMAIDRTVGLKRDIEDASRKTAKLEQDLKDKLDVTTRLKQDLKGLAVRILKNGDPIRFKFTAYQKRTSQKEGITSPSYYIFPNGYHMAIRVDTGNYRLGKNAYVSVLANFLDGRYDADLKWPFIGRITFTLLNQLEDNNHHQRSIKTTAQDSLQPGRDCGCPTFISHSMLHMPSSKNTKYLKDDTLYFRMSVEVSDHKLWLE